MGPHDPARPNGWTAEDVAERSEVIPLAIATRAAFYPDEESRSGMRRRARGNSLRRGGRARRGSAPWRSRCSLRDGW